MRGLGVTRALASALPHALVPVVAAATHLGDAGVAVLLVAAVAWLGPPRGLLAARDAARLVAIGFLVFAAVLALKSFFALGRPPASVALVAADGYGFPSGHASVAAAVYGGAAALLVRPRPRVRWLLAVVLASGVALSRLLLGVHYLVDVLAGVALGACCVVAVLAVTRERVVGGFALAVCVGAFALYETGARTAGVASLGLALGGLLGQLALSRVGRGRVDAPLAVGGFVVVGGLGVAALGTGLAAADVLLASAVAGVGVAALPAVRPTIQYCSR